MSPSEYLLREIERSLERPTGEELLERLRSRQSVEPRESTVAAVSAERELERKHREGYERKPVQSGEFDL